MKLLLGSLLLAGISWLGAAVVVPIMPNFDSQKIAKSWYPLLTIPTGQVVTTHFFPFRFIPQPNGNLKYSIRILGDAGCIINEKLMTIQDKLGDFANSEVPFTVRFVETDYRRYFIAYISWGADKKDTFLVLAGRKSILRVWGKPKGKALEAKFRNVANSLGITGAILPIVLKATC